jgi:tRNA (guanine-N7-)-methyltransferase
MQWACLHEDGDRLDLADVFDRCDQVVLDIGFGGGQELIDLARERPLEATIGVDVHTPGVARVLAAIESGLSNVRVVQGDALVFLGRLAPASLHGIRIFFPDPWPKVRQRHRRLVQAHNVDRLVERLALGGTLHLATDVDDYAGQIAAVCGAHPQLRGGVVDRPSWRPETRFELRGRAEGRTPTDLVYERIRARS